MRGSFCGVMALVAVASLALQGLGQTSSVPESGSSVLPVRYTSQPYKAETNGTGVHTKADGTSVTLQGNTFFARDSQGRSVQKGCIEMKDPDQDCSLYEYIADDPVARTQTIWRPSTHEAKVFVYPSPVPGSTSCWRVSAEDANVPKGDIPVMYKEMSCSPTGVSPAICMKDRLIKKPYDKSQIPEASYEDCLKSFLVTGFHANKVLQNKEEDLGSETIQGFDSHGCRISTTYAEGNLVRENWITRFAPRSSQHAIVLRREDQFTDSRSGAITQSTEEITTLDTSEQDLATFQPPKDYQIKTVEMHEVPCEQTKSQPTTTPAQ
jgi:hypothetical protein